MADPTDVVLAWIQDKRLQDVEDYVRRGRQLSDVPTEELMSRWVALFKHQAYQPNLVEPSLESTDIDAELQIRKIELPFELVEAEFKMIEDKTRIAYEAASKDPNRMKQGSEAALDDLTEFLERSAQTRKN